MPKPPMTIMAMLAIHLVLGMLCLAAARRDERLKGVRYWGWGMLAFAAAIVISVPTPWISRPIALCLGNIVASYAPIPTVQGAISHAGRRLNMRWTGALFALVVAVLCWNVAFGPRLNLINLTAPTVIAAGLYLHCGFALLRRPAAEARNASRLLAWVMIVCATQLILRVVALWDLLNDESTREQAMQVVELFTIAQILISVVGMLCLFWIEVLKMEHTLKTMAFGDALTGLANRRATMMRFEEMLSLAWRSQQPLTLAIFDVDFFKKVNDTHGHRAGDLVLKHVSALLSDAKRQEDLLGRVGGEEFVLLLPNTDLAGGRIIAERMRELIAEFPPQAESGQIAVTISGGLASFPQDGDSWDQIFATADRRLYRSKRGGRNRLTVAG